MNLSAIALRRGLLRLACMRARFNDWCDDRGALPFLAGVLAAGLMGALLAWGF